MRRSVLLAVALLALPAGDGARAAWSGPIRIDGATTSRLPPVTALSCPGADTCVAGDGAGDLLIQSRPGGTWSITPAALPAGGLTALACPMVTMCAGVDDHGDVLSTPEPGVVPFKRVRLDLSGAYDGADAGRGTGSVSCASPRLCVAVVDGTPYVTTHPTGGPRAWRPLPLAQDALLSSIVIACPAESLCTGLITGDGDGGPITSLIRSTDPSVVSSWHETLLPARRSILADALACPTVRLCVATGEGGAVLYSTSPASPGSWRPSRALDGGAALGSLACLPGACLVGDSAGSVTAFAPGGPSFGSARLGSAGVGALACSGSSRCLGADAGAILETSPGGWTTTRPARGPRALLGVSCAPAGTCAAVDDGGSAFTTSTASVPGSWVARTPDPGHALTAVQCTDFAGCLTGDDTGRLFSAPSPGDWSPGPPTGAAAITGIACTSPSFCALAGASRLRIGAPAGPFGEADPGEAPAALRIACASSGLCASAMLDGEPERGLLVPRLATSTAPARLGSWHGASFPHGDGVIAAVACPSTGLCVAADSLGAILTTRHPAQPAWRTATVDAGGALTALACASESFCAATDSAGRVITSTRPDGGPAAWSVAAQLSPGLASITCPAAGRCVAVDRQGDAFTTG